MKAIFLTAAIALSAPVYINSNPAGGLIITSPGSSPYRPPIYLAPLPANSLDGSQSYILTRPGAHTAPVYVLPNPATGGLIIEQPGWSTLESPVQ